MSQFVLTVRKAASGYEGELNNVWGEWQKVAREDRTGQGTYAMRKHVAFIYRPTIQALCDRARDIIKGEAMTFERIEEWEIERKAV